MKIKRDSLDSLFSEFVRLRAKGICEYCGTRTDRLQCSHFHGRRKRSTRWSEDNAIAACFKCHRYLDENPQEHTEFFLKRLGQERFDLLNMQAQTIEKHPDVNGITLYLQDLIARLTDAP